MTTRTKPVTPEQIAAWAASKRSGRLGELSRMVLAERELSEARKGACDIAEKLRRNAWESADGYRRWWFLWPLIRGKKGN